ncbi:MAG: VTT domain-containing protein [Cyclobacteriaceae bacterium]
MKNIIYPIAVSIVLVSLVFVFFEDLENYLTDLLVASGEQPGRYAFISFWVLASDILLPVPSSIVMYYNGSVLGFIKGSVISLASLFISGTVGYWIGYSSAFGFSGEKNEKAEKIIRNYGSMGMILTRGIPILSESVCITAGYNRMNFRQYTLLNVIGAVPLALVYGFFGAVGKEDNLFYYSFGLSIFVSLILFLGGRKILGRVTEEDALS